MKEDKVSLSKGRLQDRGRANPPITLPTVWYLHKISSAVSSQPNARFNSLAAQPYLTHHVAFQ